MKTKNFITAIPLQSFYAPIVFFCTIVFSYFLHKHLGMDGSWDTSNYHVYIGWATSNLLGYDFGPAAQYHTYLNPLIDVMNYVTFSIHPFLGAAVHSMFFGMAAYITFKISHFFFSESATDRALLITGIVISSTGALTVSLLGFWTNENINAVFILAGLYFLLRGINDKLFYLIFISGLTFGIALGLKLTSAHYLAGAFITAAISTKFNFKIMAALCAGFLIGFLITDGPFMYLRWEAVANPIFPFANNIFKSPYFPETWKSFSHFELSKIPYYFSLPITWISSGDFSENPTIRDGRFFLAYIGIGLIAMSAAINRKIGKLELTLTVFFLASFIAWVLVFRIYRYLIALEMLSGILFVIGLKNAFETKSKFASILIAIGSLVFLWQVTVYPDWGRREWSETFINSNLTKLIRKKEGSIVFFVGPRLTFLAPELYKEKIQFANLYSQRWWDGGTGEFITTDNSTDPNHIALSNFKKIYFLQFSNQDPRAKSIYFQNFFNGKHYWCQPVSTNMGFPQLCTFGDAGDQPPIFEVPSRQPLTEQGLAYSYNSKNIEFSNGWAPEEEGFRWTNDKKSSMKVTLNIYDECIPSFNISGFILGEQHIEFLVDGSTIFLENLSGDVNLAMHSKSKLSPGTHTMNIELIAPNARTPGNGDTRELAFALKTFKVECTKTGM